MWLLLLLLQLPSFGSAASGTVFLDEKSPIRPAVILAEAGKLEGRWLGEEVTTLQVVPDPPSEALAQSSPGYYGFKEDFFRVELPGSEVQPWSFDSAYGTFAAFALDVDGDQRDELVLETGEGRGTSVYRRHLSIYKPVAGGFRALLAYLPLNGYYFGYEPNEGHRVFALSWSRTYALERRDGRVSVIVRFTEPDHAPDGLGPHSAVEAFQFRRMRYDYDVRRQTYVLVDLDRRALP